MESWVFMAPKVYDACAKPLPLKERLNSSPSICSFSPQFRLLSTNRKLLNFNEKSSKIIWIFKIF